MRPVAVVAAGAVSALGSGRASYSVGEVGEVPASAVAVDAALAAAGLRKPSLARAAAPSEPGDRAARLLLDAARQLREQLDSSLPGWRSRRVDLIVGTSSGGMVSFLELAETRARGAELDSALARRATYFGPLAELPAALGVPRVVPTQILAACASSTIAIGLGARRLDLGHADLVIAGGYDAVSVFVAAGFESLGATTGTTPEPFRKDRDGMALGEGAALVALTTASEPSPLGYVLGFGATSDAVHVTAPDRTGSGLAGAAHRALEESGASADEIDLVSAHGTATAFNDPAEARAIERVLGDAARVPVHPFKAVIGHTLGAAGALESLAVLDAAARGVVPAAVGHGATDPDAPVRLLDRNRAGVIRAALKLSAAFGGANAALVLSPEPRGGLDHAARSVALLATGSPCTEPDVDGLVGRVALERSKLVRLDPLSALAVGAVASCVDALEGAEPERIGVVIASLAATLEINERFDSRRRSRGARAVEPRRFPATSPNLACGQCTIAFALRGPSFAVGAGPAAPVEALLAAHDLVEAGDADRVVVVVVDEVGDVVRDVWSAAGWPDPTHGALAAVVGSGDGPRVERRELHRVWSELALTTSLPGVSRAGWPMLAAAIERAVAPRREAGSPR